MAIPVPKPEGKKKRSRSTAWKHHEQRSANKLVAADDPDPKLLKPRTGDMKDGGGDTESLRWEQECKHTESGQYILKADVITKLVKDAQNKGKRALFNIQFARLPWQLCIMLWEDAKELIAIGRDNDRLKSRVSELESQVSEFKLLGGNSTNKELSDTVKRIRKHFSNAMSSLGEIEKELSV